MGTQSLGQSRDFWIAEVAAAEDRARAEGHQIQGCLALGVTVLAGGIITADIKALDGPLVASIVALSIWLLALVGTLHWSEMVAFATKRSVAEAHVESLLERGDAAIYRGLIRETRFGMFWWFGLAGTVLICGCVFGYAFVVKLAEATAVFGEMRVPFVIFGSAVAVLTVVLAVASGLRRRSAILRLPLPTATP